MIDKALIIAPHPDDEINLAGQLIIKLIRLNIEVFVLYTTNGDAEQKVGNRRIYEAICANKVLGVNKDHVIFLGYPNEWKDEKHIYNAEPKEKLMSKLGKTKTNSVKDFPEYCYRKHGVHRTFTRENFKHDFAEAIVDILPDLIVSPEFDSHPDHRAAALMTDEILGELLKKNNEYRPIVLKKYIHEGVWYGPKDYYSVPMKPTQTAGARFYSGGMHDLDSPNFRWNDRIAYQVEKDTESELLKNNIIYKAAKQHKSTTAWYEMQRVINGDIVYWLRPTSNLALNAHVECSSGNPQFINDFMQFNSNNIKKIKEPFSTSESLYWTPNLADQQKLIKINFELPVLIKCIRIYEDVNLCNHIKKLQIQINSSYLNEVELQSDGSRTEIILKEDIYSDYVQFNIIEWSGNPGLTEIEIYSKIPNELQFLPIEPYVSSRVKQKRKIIQIIEQMYMMIKFFFVFKFTYEIKRKLL